MQKMFRIIRRWTRHQVSTFGRPKTPAKKTIRTAGTQASIEKIGVELIGGTFNQR